MALTAIEGLMSAPPERAMPILKKVLNGPQSPLVKKRALFVLGQLSHPDALTILVDFAKGPENPLKGEAIRAIGIGGNSKALAALSDVYAAADDIKVKKGEPMTFVFERKTDKTCAKEVIIHVDEGNEIEKKLPLNQPVEVAVTFPKSGDVVYACGMDMVKGSIHVQ